MRENKYLENCGNTYWFSDDKAVLFLSNNQKIEYSPNTTLYSSSLAWLQYNATDDEWDFMQGFNFS
jgi:hypothetical protein